MTLETTTRTRISWGTWAGTVVFGGVGILGLMAFWSGLGLLRSGDPNRAGAITAVLMGAVLFAVAGAFLYIRFFAAPVREAWLARVRSTYPGQPWMERADWARRRVVHSNAKPALLSWIWCFGWCGGIALIATVNRDKIAADLAAGWSGWLVAAGFAAATLVGLTLTLHLTWHWLVYGRSVLSLDTLPGVPGEPFRATLTARLPTGQRPDVAVELVCEQVTWITSGTGKNRTTRAVVDRLGGVRTNVEGRRGAATRQGFVVPLAITVPGGLPDSGKDDRGDGIQWMLHVRTDSGYAAVFEVPVFERAEKGRQV